MALAGLDATALILGWLAGELLQTVMMWLAAPPPLPRLRREPAREVLSYGAPASLAAASWFGFRNVDYAVIGARLGAASTGFYLRAYTLGVEYQKKVSQIVNTVGFPVLARTQTHAEMSELRVRMVRLLTIVLFAPLALLAVEAPVLVPWLFGQRWAPAVVPTQILAIGGASTLVIDAAGAQLMAAGRARSMMAFGWGHFAAYGVAVFLIAPLGLTAIAIGAAAVHTLFLLIAYALMLRGEPANPLARLWRDVMPALVSCVPLVAAALVADRALAAAHTEALLRITLVSAAGLTAYVLTLRTLFGGPFRGVVGFLSHLLPRRRGVRARRWLSTSESSSV